MSSDDERRAWSRLYALLGQALLDGWTPDVLETAQALPALAEALPDLEPEQLSARHFKAFGTGVPPHVSAILSEEGVLGGAESQAAREWLERCGYRHRRTDTEPDHLGILLRTLGFLIVAELDATEDGHHARAAEIRELQRQGLHDFVLPSWPPIAMAFGGGHLSEWTAVTQLLSGLIARHWGWLGGGEVAPLPQSVDMDLADERVGLKQIAAWLCLPARSGVRLTPMDLADLAEEVGVPRGFGTRSQVLENILHAAADRQDSAGALESLHAWLTRWIHGLRELEALGLPVGGWLTRAFRAAEVITQMQAALRVGETEG